jgi:adenylylsulfate kinase
LSIFVSREARSLFDGSHEGKLMRDIVWHQATVNREMREARNKHRGVVMWFTGLSGAGKSTLAYALENRLFGMGFQTMVLDGDNVRHGLCEDLGFSDEDRRENIRRVGEVAKLFAEAGIITIAAFISPFREDRTNLRKLMAYGDFLEIHVDCPLEVCESRDVKGFYRKARSGEISSYTGISSPYEVPEQPDCRVNTAINSHDVCLSMLIRLLQGRGVIDLTSY